MKYEYLIISTEIKGKGKMNTINETERFKTVVLKAGMHPKKLLQGGGRPAKCGNGSNPVKPTLPAEALRRRAFFMGHVV